MKSKSTGKRAMSAGVGPSKRFTAPEGTFEGPRLLSCHVDGVLVKDLPADLMARITYRITDEGLAEANEGKTRPYGSGARVTRGEFDGQVQRFGDFRRENPRDQAAAPDPFEEARQKYEQPGMKIRLLSKRTSAKRGMRGYQPVLDKDGKQVEVAGMMVAEIPREVYDERRRIVSERAYARVRHVHNEANDQRVSELRKKGIREDAVEFYSENPSGSPLVREVGVNLAATDLSGGFELPAEAATE